MDSGILFTCIEGTAPRRGRGRDGGVRGSLTAFSRCSWRSVHKGRSGSTIKIQRRGLWDIIVMIIFLE